MRFSFLIGLLFFTIGMSYAFADDDSPKLITKAVISYDPHDSIFCSSYYDLPTPTCLVNERVPGGPDEDDKIGYDTFLALDMAKKILGMKNPVIVRVYRVLGDDAAFVQFKDLASH